MDWESEVAAVRSTMDSMHAAREEALKRCRLLIQTSAKCIRHVHRRQFTEAQALLSEAVQISATTREDLAEHPELFYAGYLQDAEKELVEAAAIVYWVCPCEGDRYAPTVAGLRVGVVSYLNGMGEAASECRRYVLDEMRKGHLNQAEELLLKMETVYDDLVTFDFPDALTGGLRRTCDALRAVIERTRADLTMTRVQHDLMVELQRSRENMPTI